MTNIQQHSDVTLRDIDQISYESYRLLLDLIYNAGSTNQNHYKLKDQVDSYIMSLVRSQERALARMYSAIGRDDLTWGQSGLPEEVLEMFPEFRVSTADIPRGKKQFMDFVVEELKPQAGDGGGG